MSIKEENKLENIFSGHKEKEIEKIIKNKRRILAGKNIIIVIFISVAVTGMFLKFIYNRSTTNTQVVLEQSLKKATDEYRMSKPNTYIGEVRVSETGLNNYYIEIINYKRIGSKTLYNGSDIVNKDMFSEMIYSDDMRSSKSKSPLPSLKIENRECNSYGIRNMFFYYDYVKYDEIINDIEVIKDISDEKIIEVGISLDKGYNYDEIQKMFPFELSTFYWVQPNRETLSENNIEYDISNQTVIPGDNIGGVKLIDRDGKRYSFDEIKSYKPKMEENGEEIDTGITGNNIYGVVLVGKPSEIYTLKSKPYIRALTLGTVVDKY